MSPAHWVSPAPRKTESIVTVVFVFAEAEAAGTHATATATTNRTTRFITSSRSNAALEGRAVQNTLGAILGYRDFGFASKG
jgi:hypothetical protein